MRDKTKPKYAKVTNLDIRSIVESDENFNYFFRDKIFALKKIALLKEKYIVSIENEELGPNELVLWIRNYDVTPEERLAGYKGNFGRIFIQKIDNEKDAPDNDLFPGQVMYTLCIEKIHRLAKFHPDRKVVKRRHPNWGNPILRQIRNKPDHTYPSSFEAYDELKRLNEDYPYASILARQMLFIMVYEKDETAHLITDSRPIRKIILEVKEVADDQFKITWRPNPVEGKLKRDKINMVSFSFFS